MLEFDHVAISGETLQAAQDYVENALGVPLQAGGEHDVFHTHNALLGLKDGLYLEAIAINPDAPNPDRPRWFDLDEFTGKPRLTNWICRTSKLSEVIGNTQLDFGAPVALKRADLQWDMAVPKSGRLPFDNCAPALIQWKTPNHPASRMTQKGVELRRLTVSHPRVGELGTVLASMLTDDRIAFESGKPGLSADFMTPHGARELRL